MMQIISILIQFVFNAIKYLLGFLTIFILGIAGAAMYALPWLIRLATILIWLIAGLIGIQTIQAIYSPFSDSIPLFALQFAVIVIMVAWALVAMKDGRQVWGILATGGLVVASFSYGALWLVDHWKYADLFFRILPTSLFVSGMFYITVRMRAKRKHETHSTRLNTQPVSA